MTFPKYPEYKHSGVKWLGEVPVHWAVKRLRYVAELTPSKSEVRTLPAESSVSFIPMEAVGEDGSLSLEQTRPIGEVLAGYTYVREGDVTIAKITPCFENGKGAVMRGLKNHVGFGTTELTVMRPIAGLTTSDYLYRVVSSEPFRVLGESSMYGAGGQKRVPDDFVRNFSIAWPPYKEQEQIQAFLDHETARIDALVEEQQRLVALLKEKRQTVISHAVTKGLDPDVPMKDSGVEWLGEVPAHWEVRKIAHSFKRIGSGTTPPSNEQKWYEGGSIPWVTTSELRENVIVETKKSVTEEALSEFTALQVHPPGSLAIAMYGATIGRLGVFGVSATANQACCVLSGGRGIGTEFVYYWLLAFKDIIISLYANGGGQPNINQETISSLRIPAPSLDDQEGISAYLDDETSRIEALVEEGESVIELLQERRSALISAAVTGKIDVRGWKAEQPPEQPEVLKAAEARATYG